MAATDCFTTEVWTWRGLRTSYTLFAIDPIMPAGATAGEGAGPRRDHEPPRAVDDVEDVDDVVVGTRLAPTAPMNRQCLSPGPVLASCFAVVTAAISAVGQCTTTWQAGDAVPGASAPVTALAMHDPDGPGPAAPVLLAGGAFEVAGDAVVHGLAAFDPATGGWSQFAGDVEGASGIHSLLSLPNGDLVAGGEFWRIGGVPAVNIARFDGTAWRALGPNLTSGRVNALAPLGNGDLVAAGAFQGIGGVAASRVARWDGSRWQAMGGGLPAEVHDLTVRANGTLVAAGSFAGGVAEWDGVSWNVVQPSLYAVQAVRSVLEVPGGELVIGGVFWVGPGAAVHVARRGAAGWSALGGLDRDVYDLALLPANDICAVGPFQFKVARWNGSTWSPLGLGFDDGSHVSEVVVGSGGSVFAGGAFARAGGAIAQNLARWSGGIWSALGSGTSAEITALAAVGDEVVAAGSFDRLGAVAAANIARFANGAWSPLGAGVDGRVEAVVTLPTGDVVAGGQFANAGGVPAPALARWDGASWRAVGGPNLVAVNALAVLAGGDFVAASQGLTIALHRFASGAATAIPGPGAWREITALAGLPNGDLLVGGAVGSIQPHGVHRWDGNAWTSLGAATGGPGLLFFADFAVLPGGDLVAAGRFRSVGGVAARNIARWDGSSWHPLGGGLSEAVRGVEVLPDGQLLAIGDFEFAGGAPAAHVARWDGSAWHPVDGGLGDPGAALAVTRSGTVFAGGGFASAGGRVSANLARWRPSCPAAETTLAAACPSTNGPMSLAITSLPWTGGVFAARCSGLAAGALDVVVVGLTSPGTPLTAFHPAAAPNCDLLASPDATLLLVAAGGTADFALPVARIPAFAGLALNTQVLQLEPAATSNALSASNAVRVTVGTY